MKKIKIKKNKSLEAQVVEEAQIVEAAPVIDVALTEEVLVEASENADAPAVEASDALGTDADASVEAATETVEVAVGETVVAEGAPADSELDATPKITDRAEIIQVLESIIFASPKAMSLVRLRNLLNSFQYDTSNLSEILEEMATASESRGFQLLKVAGGYQYRTHPKNSDVLQKLLEDKPARLSASALEVLTIVAYKQPLTRSEIDTIRGVDSGHLLKGLLEKNLVRTAGHAETVGRPLLYQSTPYFLEVFSLGSLDDLPAIDEFKRELVGNDSESAETAQMDVFAADPAFYDRDSPLAANPDRGAFDQKAEDVAELPDFGLTERAREESLPS